MKETKHCEECETEHTDWAHSGTSKVEKAAGTGYIADRYVCGKCDRVVLGKRRREQAALTGGDGE